MTQALELDQFLGYQTNSRGNYLTKWKDRNPPCVNVWLSKRSTIYALWRHQFPRLVDKDGSIEFWGGNYNCWEPDTVLREQHRREKDGSRIVPPTKCGLCLCSEHLRTLIDQGDLKWTDPVFDFEATDRRKSQTIHAGGFTGMFGKRNMDDDEKAELKEARIVLADAWKENGLAKASYLFVVVDHDDVKAGVQIAIETGSLGDKVKRVIKDRMTSKGEIVGNPLKTPYAFQWQYDERARQFNDKYHALLMDELKLTPQLEKLLNAPPPDVSSAIERFNPIAMRAAMEQYCVIDLPWDDFFPEDAEAPAHDAAPAPAPQRAAGRAPEVGRGRAAPATAPAPEPAPDPNEEFECDNCDQIILVSTPECPKCGTKYDVPAPPPPPEPARRPKRSEARGAAAKPAPAAPPDPPKRGVARARSVEPPAAAGGRRPMAVRGASAPAAGGGGDGGGEVAADAETRGELEDDVPGLGAMDDIPGDGANPFDGVDDIPF